MPSYDPITDPSHSVPQSLAPFIILFVVQCLPCLDCGEWQPLTPALLDNLARALDAENTGFVALNVFLDSYDDWIVYAESVQVPIPAATRSVYEEEPPVEEPVVPCMACAVQGANKDGKTGLIIAATSDHQECLRQLLVHGADASAVDKKGRCALFCASANNHVACCSMLLEAAPDSVAIEDKRGDTALHAAACNGHAECLQLLLGAPGADPNRGDRKGHTPVHLAKSRACLEHLVHADKVDLCRLDKAGRTPFFHACAHSRLDCVALFLDLDEDCDVLNYPDSRGDTPLHACACNGQLGAVRLLLETAADPTIRNCLGYLPAYLADCNGHTEVLALLNQYSEYHRGSGSGTGGQGAGQGAAGDMQAYGNGMLENAVAAVTPRGMGRVGRPETEDIAVLAGVAAVSGAGQGAQDAWSAAKDPESGAVYYFHAESGVTQWEKPIGWGERGKGTVNLMTYSASGGGGGGGGGGKQNAKPKLATKSAQRDYLRMVSEYAQHRPYHVGVSHHSASVVAGGTEGTGTTGGTGKGNESAIPPMCCVCAAVPAAWVFLPCEHACACAPCAEGNHFLPARKSPLAGAAAGGGTLKRPRCPLCQSNIARAVPFSGAEMPRDYGPPAQLSAGFREGFLESAKTLGGGR